MNNIDKRLAELGQKRANLLQNLDLPKSSITHWSSRGNIPSGDICYRIAKYLDVSVEWLLTGIEDEIPRAVLNLAYEVMALPPLLKQIVFDTVESCKRQQSAREKASISDVG